MAEETGEERGARLVAQVEKQHTEFVEELAIKMFDAYNEEGPNPWKTFDGRDVPRWPDLSEQVREKWRAAASKAQEELED